MMNRIFLTLASLAFSSALASAQIILNAVGSFDPKNSIEALAPSSFTTIDNFKAEIQSAFNSNTGGVWNFEATAGYSVNTLASSFQINYASGAKNIAISSDVDLRNASYGSATATSGNHMLDKGELANQNGAFTFSFAVNGDLNEKITKIGIVALSRNSVAAHTFQVTATLNDATFITLSDEVNIGSNLDDTAFLISAPDGKWINSVTFDGGASSRPIVDDFAFVTAVVPEPQTYAFIVAAGALLLVFVRRRC